VKPNGKNCELILKELAVQEYAIGKTKVSDGFTLLSQFLVITISQI